MSSDPTSVPMRLAERLYNLEMLIDQVVTAGAEMAAALPQARIEAKLPAVVGQPALQSIGEVVAAGITMRHHVVAAHRHLDKVRELTGMPEVNYGDVGPKPKQPGGTDDNVISMVA